MSARNIVISIVLLGAIATSWLMLNRQKPVAPQPAAQTESGYYLRDATIEGMGQDGQRLYTLSAQRIQQKTADNSVSLEVVRLEYAGTDADPWRLTADKGSIPAEGDQIELTGNVTIEEMLFIGPEMTLVTTPELSVDLRAQLATTDANVRIQRGNYLLTAVGLRADLKDKKLRLQSEVHGHFLP